MDDRFVVMQTPQMASHRHVAAGPFMDRDEAYSVAARGGVRDDGTAYMFRPRYGGGLHHAYFVVDTDSPPFVVHLAVDDNGNAQCSGRNESAYTYSIDGGATCLACLEPLRIEAARRLAKIEAAIVNAMEKQP